LEALRLALGSVLEQVEVTALATLAHVRRTENSKVMVKGWASY
jgi:hypothetical protein